MALNTTSKTLFVGNLHASLDENDLLNVFKPFGNIVECCKKWCHYGFIQFSTEDEAKLAYSNLNGSKLRGRHMRIEFQKKKIKNIPMMDAENKENPFRNVIFHDILDLDGKENFGACDDLLKLILASNSVDLDSLKKKNEPEMVNKDTNNVLRSLVFNTNDLSKSKNATNVFKPSSKQNMLSNLAKPETKCYTDPLESLTNDLIFVDKENQQYHDSENNTFQSLYNFLDYNLNTVKNTSNSLKNEIDESSSTSSSSSSPSCNTMKLFKSINSSNTIFIQPHDVLTPLNDGEFREYKLFPIVQN